ncbi:hypothetical protein H5410_051497 [Solanum commersonii]|uniref:Uncharacterized protein n=1 Tax=Solanum commersonii TaxID=4109 RepID=A0A9J5X0V6_SOLCO|nr:hypothetical protein H5410_051497 [Solanum commersonii]
MKWSCITNQASMEGVTIDQFNATKEKHLIVLVQAIMENTLSCKSKLSKEGYYFSIQATMKWYGLTKSSYHAKHLIMLVQANHW